MPNLYLLSLCFAGEVDPKDGQPLEDFFTEAGQPIVLDDSDLQLQIEMIKKGEGRLGDLIESYPEWNVVEIRVYHLAPCHRIPLVPKQGAVN